MSNHKEVLTGEVERRAQEVSEYDLNLKIYLLALKKSRANGNQDAADHNKILEDLIRQTEVQRARSAVMLESVTQLLAEV